MNVGFFCYSPASVNSLLPLIYHKDGFCTKSVFFGSEKAKELFSTHESFKGFIFDIKDSFDDFVLFSDVVFYVTGSGDSLELTIPSRTKAIKETTITVAIQDIFWDSADGFKRRYSELPNYIIVSSEKEKQLIVENLSLQKDSLLLFGNPHFSRLVSLEYKEDRPPSSVSFISQCGMGGTYDEPTHDVCQKAILELVAMNKSNFISELVVYKHPRENDSFYKEHNISFSETNDFSDMLRSDYIISNGSTPHYEAALLGKKNLFVFNGELKYRLLNGETDEVVLSISDKSASKIYDWIFDLYF